MGELDVTTYELKFIVDGEILVSENIPAGSEITLPTDPTKIGYTFNGWDPEVPSVMPAENQTFTALWARLRKYLDYGGLAEFKSKLDYRRECDRVELEQALEIIGEGIDSIPTPNNSIITLYKNEEEFENLIDSFTLDQSTNKSIIIPIPETLSDLDNNSVDYIKNIINYGQSTAPTTDEAKANALINSGYALLSKLNIHYNSGTKLIQLRYLDAEGNQTLIGNSIDASAFILDGFLERVALGEGTGDNLGKLCLIFDFNTDSGITDIEIPLENIFDSDRYYTKEEIDDINESFNGLLDNKVDSSDLATVATSGSYNDLTDKPVIPEEFSQSQSNWTLEDSSAIDYIKNKPTLSEVAISGDYNDLSNIPTDISSFNNDAGYLTLHQDISGKVDLVALATVATSGSYNDLSNKPTIPVVPTNISAFTNDSGYLVAADIAGKADKSDTYTKDEVDQIIEEVEVGQGSSLSNYYTKTQIDSQQQVQDVAIANKANSADLATVATSGSYNDLSNTPTIPTVPTNVSSFTNDAGYLTSHQDISGKANTADLATVAMSGDYDDLTNKPTNISDFTNDVGYLTEHLSLEEYALKNEIPTSVSELNNDAGYLTEHQSLTNYALKSELPTKTSDLTNDSGFLTEHQSLANYALKSELPTNVSELTNDSGYLTEHQSLAAYALKSELPIVPTNVSAFTNDSGYLTEHLDISGKADSSSLSLVATSGSYNDLSDKPTIPAALIQSDWEQTINTELDYIKNKPNLASVAISGSYNDLNNKPSLSTVATTGSYNDLLNKPTIPFGTITSVKMNGTTVASSGEADLGTVITAHLDISGKENATMIQVKTSSISTLNCEVDLYYRLNTTVNTLSIKLPAMTDTTKVKTVVICLTTGSSPAITISSTAATGSSAPSVYFSESFDIEAHERYEINCLWNGSYWVVMSFKILTNN